MYIPPSILFAEFSHLSEHLQLFRLGHHKIIKQNICPSRIRSASN